LGTVGDSAFSFFVWIVGGVSSSFFDVARKPNLPILLCTIDAGWDLIP
jgi:hypothetical protein